MKNRTHKSKCPLSSTSKQQKTNSIIQLNLDIMKAKAQAKEKKWKPNLQSSQTSTSNNHSKYFPSSIEAIRKNSEYDRNYLNDSYEKETLDFRPEPMPIKADSQLNSNLFENEMDKKLKYALKTLDLYQFRKHLIDNCISFNDILLLSKNDLIEMGIQLGPRNRILKFAEQYKAYAKEFDFDELKRFFTDNKNFVINSIGNDETQNSTIKKKIEMDLLKASMDKLCKEMSESSSQMVSGYEDKLIQQQQNNRNNNQLQNNNGKSLKHQNIDIPDISEIKVKEEEDENHHRTRNTNSTRAINNIRLQYRDSNLDDNCKKITNENYPMHDHRRQRSHQNFFKRKQIKTIKRNWTLPKPIFFGNNYTFSQIATLKTSRSMKSNRQISPLLESNSNFNTRNLFYQRAYNQCMNKKEKVKQTYKVLFIEIEAYQQEYQNMKIKAGQRNIHINHMLRKADQRPVIYHNNNHNKQQPLKVVHKPTNENSGYNKRTEKVIDSTKHKSANSESNALSDIKLTDSESLGKINEIFAKKRQLKNTLNECRESINQKKKIIERLNDDENHKIHNNNHADDDMKYLFNL